MVCGSYWWLWVVKKKLGTLGKGFGRKKEKGMVVFQGYTKNNVRNTLVLLLSRKEAFLTHKKTYRRSQRSDCGHVPMNLQTKFREDPTVNERWASFLQRQLHVAFSRSFIKRLPPEASSWLL